MTKRDFELIATVLQGASALAPADLADLAEDFADALKATNQQFNRERFIRACVPGANVRARG
jgi:hypothetical protein